MTCRCPQLVSLNALALPNLTSPRPLGGCRAAGVQAPGVPGPVSGVGGSRMSPGKHVAICLTRFREQAGETTRQVPDGPRGRGPSIPQHRRPRRQGSCEPAAFGPVAGQPITMSWRSRRPAPARPRAARCAALTADDSDAEPLYRKAVTAHEGDGRPFEQARTRLLYGEWLRRNRRRAGAREHLLAAAAAFARMGARPWQERAEAELRAAGAGAPAVTADDPLARLTPQELRVVRLAASAVCARSSVA